MSSGNKSRHEVKIKLQVQIPKLRSCGFGHTLSDACPLPRTGSTATFLQIRFRTHDT